MSIRKVTDVEIHFATGEPAVFTCDGARGDDLSQAETGERRYLLRPAPDVEEVFVFPDWTRVNYVRVVTRPADEDEVLHVPGGITVSGDIPEPA
jgi:hypothetical protein